MSIITDVSLDHQRFLGETIPEIAREKAGIIRPGGAAVTLPQLAEANDVIGHAILDAGARAVNAVPYVPPVSPGSAEFWETGKTLIAKDAKDGAEFAEKGRQRRQRYPLDVLGTKSPWTPL